MKKLLISLFTVALVAGGVWAGTKAYFSDTETATANTFATGTIDIAVDGNNPWSKTGAYQLTDMKPSTVNYWEFKVKNVGNNNANVWKRLYNFKYQPAPNVSLPPRGEQEERYDPRIGGVIRYDMDINGTPLFTEQAGFVLDQPEDGHVLTDTTPVADKYICLGMLEPGKEITVRQSYHMDGSTGNWAQGAQMQFDVDLFAQQVVGGPPAPEDQLKGYECKTLDYVDIGNVMSESGHNLQAWSNNQTGVPFNGTNYSGGSSDKSFRLLMGPGDPLVCGTGSEGATFTLEAGSASASKLIIEHLDGSQNDSFDVYVNNVLVDHYTSVGGHGENNPANWITTPFNFPAASGLITVKLVATNPVTGWCNQYGQVAFSNAQLSY